MSDPAGHGGRADGTARTRGLARHLAGFVIAGGSAFLVDAAVTIGLTASGFMDPYTARVAGIFAAMIVAWLLHRRLTFNVATPPSFAEFGRFAAVAWTANLINYGIYALIIATLPAVGTLAALVVATAVAMVVSYVGFRIGVFREFRPDA